MVQRNSKKTGRKKRGKRNNATEGKPKKPLVTGKAVGSGASKNLVPLDTLQRYMQMVRKIPRLDKEEERRLALRVTRFNDQDAALKLVASNLWLVIKISYEFHHQFQNMLDLIQEGNIGLMRAVKRFDPFKGARLPTYATYWIRAYVLKYLLDNWRLVRVGTTNVRRKLLFNLNSVVRELQAEGVKPEVKLLAERFSASEEDVISVQEVLASTDVSLEAPVADDSARTYAEVIGEEKPAMDETLGDKQLAELVKTNIKEFAVTLKSSEQAILFDRLMSDEPLTLAEIGEKFGVTREAVRQAEARLKKKLKKRLEEKIPGISGFGFIPK